MQRNYLTFCFFSAFLILLGCNRSGQQTNPRFRIALRLAGSNSEELIRTIEHYSASPQDSLKLKAAYFLIENMPGKGSYRLTKRSVNGKNCSFNIFDPKFQFGDGIISISKLKKKYEDSTGSGLIYYTDPEFVSDIRTITSGFLIENIDYAFKAWELPWAKNLTFKEFSEYILPYRFGSEPLEPWRKRFFEKGNRFRVSGTSDRLKLASLINGSLVNKYSYLNEWITYYDAPLSIGQIETLHGGRCPDLNVLVGCMMRANGLPTASEFTDHWGNGTAAGHAWISVLDVTGRFTPMNAVYDNPVRGLLPFKNSNLAKGYRMIFKVNSGFYEKKRGPQNYFDITSEYVPVTDYKLKVEPSGTGDICIAVLNGLEWKTVVTEKYLKKDTLVFKNLARGIIYSRAYMDGDSVKHIDSPFFITASGKIQELKVNNKELTTIALDAATFDVRRYNGSLYSRECGILFWDECTQKWRNAGEVVKLRHNPETLIKEKRSVPVYFKDIPSNGLYLVVDRGKKPINRNCGRPYFYNIGSGRFDQH